MRDCALGTRVALEGDDAADDELEGEENDAYSIERIVGERVDENGETWFKVVWANYPLDLPEDELWVRRQDVNAPALLAAYKTAKRKRVQQETAPNTGVPVGADPGAADADRHETWYVKVTSVLKNRCPLK